MGVLFALLALAAWGIGDFFIQRSTRKIGDWMTIFFICTSTSIALFPFVFKSLPDLFSNVSGLLILLLASVIFGIATVADFEALRVGKISIVEPIYALEVPVATFLASALIREKLSLNQWVLIALLVMGIILVSVRSLSSLSKARFEKGVVLALVATLFMGMSNFMFGVGSRATHPLLINWFTGTFLAIFSFVYLIVHHRTREICDDWRLRKKLIISVGFFDNLAWIAFSYSTLYIPIAIATGISESYIAFAVILGIYFNKEKIKRHQVLGLVLALSAVIALALITGD